MRPHRRRPRRLLTRLAGLLLLLIMLEGALQLAAPLIQSAMSRRPVTPDPDSPLAVLCVGDSNTYGLHLPQVYAYPALLANQLDRCYRHAVRVVNRGVPGQSSAQVAEHLPDDLRAVDPDLVLILAGINDTWNIQPSGGGPVSWLSRLRLVRLLRVLLAGVTSSGSFAISTDEQGEIVVDRGRGARRVNSGQGAAGTLGGQALQESVRRGLAMALDACRDHGAVPVLLTYAENGGPFDTVNAAVRALASERQVMLVDLAREFRGHFERQGHDALMFSDHHPNLQGYRLAADQVARALQEAGLVPLPLANDERARPPVTTPERPPRLATLADGRLSLAGPPGWAWQLLVSHPPRPGDGFDAGEFRIPLPSDEILATARLEPGFSGRFGQDGRQLLTIPAPLRRRAGGPLAACLLLLNDDPNAASAVAAVSEVTLLP